MSRRLIRLLIVFASAAVCSTSVLAQVEVRLWTLLSGADGVRMRAIIADFNASQHDVKVTSGSVGNRMGIKARLFAPYGVAHPRDSIGYRCGGRLV